jgi:membrane protein DedA with SNARE-associated domain
VVKFIPGIASISSTSDGASGSPLTLFVVFDTLSTSLWAGSAIYLNSLFSTTVDDLLDVLEQLGIWSMLLIGIALTAFVGRRWLERKHFLHSLRMARLSPVGQIKISAT